MRGLSALHDAHPHDRAKRTAVHPVVRIDRESRRKALCVNEHFTRRIVEMSARYRWTAGTIGMWDNRFTQHDVVNDFVGERVIKRVTIMGDLVNGTQPCWRPWPEVVGGTSAMNRHDRQLMHHLRARVAGAAK